MSCLEFAKSREIRNGRFAVVVSLPVRGTMGSVPVSLFKHWNLFTLYGPLAVAGSQPLVQHRGFVPRVHSIPPSSCLHQPHYLHLPPIVTCIYLQHYPLLAPSLLGSTSMLTCSLPPSCPCLHFDGRLTSLHALLSLIGNNLPLTGYPKFHSLQTAKGSVTLIAMPLTVDEAWLLIDNALRL